MSSLLLLPSEARRRPSREPGLRLRWVCHFVGRWGVLVRWRGGWEVGGGVVCCSPMERVMRLRIAL